MEEVFGARCRGKGAEPPRPLWGHHPLSASTCLPTQEPSEPHHLGVLWKFYYKDVNE